MNPRILELLIGNRWAKIILISVVLLGIGTHVFSEPPIMSFLPKEDLPEGWALVEGPKVYTKKTLFERVNGQAELYFKYGFEKSVFAVYQNKKSNRDQIEVDIYDMGNVLQAFGIFSRFRNEERPGGFGLDSYLDDQTAFFYKGKYFVLLYATEPDPSVLKRMAGTVAVKIGDPSPPPRQVDYFPREGLKPGSIQYFSEGLLGYQFLKRGFQGTYSDKAQAKAEAKVEDKSGTGGKESHLFLAMFKNAHEATDALKTYRDHLSRKGNVQSEIPPSFGSNALKGEDPYKGRVMVAQKGVYLLGIIGFENDKKAGILLSEFINNTN
jgi:hypothetical protein